MLVCIGRKIKSWQQAGVSCLFRHKGIKVSTTWVNILALLEVLPSAHGGRCWLCGQRDYGSHADPCISLNNGISILRLFSLPLWTFLAVELLTLIHSGYLQTVNSCPFPGSTGPIPFFSTQPPTSLVYTHLSLGCSKPWHTQSVQGSLCPGWHRTTIELSSNCPYSISGYLMTGEWVVSLEELHHSWSQGRWPGGANPCPRSRGCAGTRRPRGAFQRSR